MEISFCLVVQFYSICSCDDVFACSIFNYSHMCLLCVYVWVNYPCLLCKTVSKVNIHDSLYVPMSINYMHCMHMYIWLYVGRWQIFVFTTSVLAVCVCGFLYFTAASSSQPHRSSVFSLSVSLTSLTSWKLFSPLCSIDFITSSDHWTAWRCFRPCWSSTQGICTGVCALVLLWGHRGKWTYCSVSWRHPDAQGYAAVLFPRINASNL